jgi:cytochrome c oxidase cbb3-type subunit III
MSSAWSWLVILLVASNILGCVWLLWYTARRRGTSAEIGDTTGHVWDGITEYNKPLPRWWIVLFYLTIVFSIGYLLIYPGLGNFRGTSDWTSQREHAAAKAAAEEKLAVLFAQFEGRPLEALATDAEALRLGRSVFANHCTTCHGSDARGAKGFPNLANGRWQWGGDPTNVLHTVMHGRQATMPALGTALGSEQAITEVVVHVQGLSGRKTDARLAAAGAKRFQMMCAACHGANGTGNAAMGAPNLTDAEWLYGGDFNSIRTSIVEGRRGKMPAHGALLGETRARLVAAWVLALSQQTADAAADVGLTGSASASNAAP